MKRSSVNKEIISDAKSLLSHIDDDDVIIIEPTKTEVKKKDWENEISPSEMKALYSPYTWVSDDVLRFVSQILNKKYISKTHTYTHVWNKERITPKKIKNCSYVISFVNMHKLKHWIVLYWDLERKICAIYDSLGWTTAEKLKDNFKTAKEPIGKHNEDQLQIKNFTFQTRPVHYQAAGDGSNCGIYSIYFALYLSKYPAPFILPPPPIPITELRKFFLNEIKQDRVRLPPYEPLADPEEPVPTVHLLKGSGKNIHPSKNKDVNKQMAYVRSFISRGNSASKRGRRFHL